MKPHRMTLSLLLLWLSLVIMACSLFNPGEKIDELQGTIQALTTQVGESQGDSPPGPTEPVEGMEDGVEAGESTTSPQSDGRLELVGQYGGSAAAVAVSGDYAYLGQGPRLVVLDISDPANPRFISQSDVLPGIVLGVEVKDRYIYVTTRYGGLNIFESGQGGELTRLGYAEPENPGCGSIELVDDIAYIACNPGGLFIVDVTNPAEPNVLSDSGVTGSYISVAVVNDHAYLADINGGGLMVAEVSDPANPRRAGTFDVGEIPGEYTKMIASVDACGDELCLAVQNYGLVVLSLQEPGEPEYLAGDPQYFPSGIVVQGGFAYLLADAEPGVLVYDISNTLQPQRVGILPTSVGGLEFAVNELPERGMFISDGHLYIPDQMYGLTIVDVRNPTNPVLEARYMTPVPDLLTDIIVQGGYAFVVSRSGGFRVVDVTDPLNPREIYYDDERKNLYLQVPTALDLIGNYAFVADANFPLHAYAVNNPGKAVEVSALYDEAASDGAHDMVIAGDYAYLSGWGLKDAFFPGKGIWVVDISNPENLSAVRFVDLPNGRWSLAISGTSLYALDGEMDPDQPQPFSLRILDISDGENPVEVTAIPIPELQTLSPSDIAVAGNELYLSAGMTGLKRYDITDPQKPVELPVDANLFRYVFQLQAEVPYLVINGNQVMDISLPESPVMIGYTAEVLEGWASDVAGDLLYLATRMHGIYIYRIPQ